MRRPSRHDLRALWRGAFSDPRRERQFLATLAFLVAFGIARLLAHSIRGGLSWFGDVTIGGRHVHHLVWGIGLLLFVGYAWLLETPQDPHSRRAARALAVLYGVGAALTLDEFALWLNLRDVYWEREGRVSLDAIALFGGMALAGFWGGPFFRAVGREVVRVGRFTAHLARRAARRARRIEAPPDGSASASPQNVANQRDRLRIAPQLVCCAGTAAAQKPRISPEPMTLEWMLRYALPAAM